MQESFSLSIEDEDFLIDSISANFTHCVLDQYRQEDDEKEAYVVLVLGAHQYRHIDSLVSNGMCVRKICDVLKGAKHG